ncbi:MAG: NfeD family protein [Spirochaetota bacterium]
MSGLGAPIWLAIGVAVMALEIIMPGFVLFWFGISGVFTGALVFLGILPGGTSQWIFFFAMSAALVALWFGVLKKRLVKNDKDDARDPTLADIMGKVSREIKPDIPGEVTLFSSYHGIKVWKAASHEELPVDTEVRVVESSGIILQVVRK